MQDYAKLYRHEHRKCTVQAEKLRRIKIVLKAALPRDLAWFAIALIMRKY